MWRLSYRDATIKNQSQDPYSCLGIDLRNGDALWLHYEVSDVSSSDMDEMPLALPCIAMSEAPRIRQHLISDQHASIVT